MSTDLEYEQREHDRNKKTIQFEVEQLNQHNLKLKSLEHIFTVQ